MRVQGEGGHWKEVPFFLQHLNRGGEDEDSIDVERGRGGVLRKFMWDSHPEISDDVHSVEGLDGSSTITFLTAINTIRNVTQNQQKESERSLRHGEGHLMLDGTHIMVDLLASFYDFL